MGRELNGQFISSYESQRIDVLLGMVEQAASLVDPQGFVADIVAAQEAAETAQAAAEGAEDGAEAQATLAESWAIGGTGTRTGEDADNAKYWSEAASNSSINAAGYATTAGASATQASSSASTAASNATLSKSWAVGGTGTRSGEDTNNAKYWSEQAQHAAGGGVTSFNNRSGVVLPQSGDYTPDMVGAVPALGMGKNLARNAYFIGGGSQQGGGQLPINQQGLTSYSRTGTGRQPCIDGWYLYGGAGTSGSLSVGANGLSVTLTATASNNGELIQELDWIPVPGETVTLSVLLGEISGAALSARLRFVDSSNTYSGAITITNLVAGLNMVSNAVPANSVKAQLRIFANGAETGSVTVKAVKVELGNTQTLARKVNNVWTLCDPAPSYTEEYLRCATSFADSADNWANCWLNPPLMPSVEYRTTERWRGFPVYAQVLEPRTLSATGSKVFDGNTLTNINRLIRVEGNIGKNSIQMAPGIVGITVNSSSQLVIETSNAPASTTGASCVPCVYYTKSTDTLPT